MTESTFPVKGMSCSHCQASVTKALKGVQGVSEAVVNLDKQQATVTFDPAKVTSEKLAKAVEDAGFTLVMA